ncbi:MAG TPA: SGNH/GDSL hydrolase family protein [Vicinamibacterales bacterium]|nr:SGNH/GDSL hydrolase family protein [Vicinamibacterales bacterium]
MIDSTNTTPHNRGRRRAFAASLVISLLIAQEIVFRAAFPLPDVEGFNRIRYQMLAGAHPNLAQALRRGLVYDKLLIESTPDGFREIHRLNLYGFRGDDFALAAPADRERILLIGDSVTEGQGAAESFTIAAGLARLQAASGEVTEVLNLGVIAAALPHLTALTRDAISLLDPQVLVLILYANDLPAPVYPPQLELPAPTFPRRRVAGLFPRALELLARVAQNKPIYRRWGHSPMRFFAAVPDPSNPWSASTGPPIEVEPALYQAMTAGTLNPWLVEQARAIPDMLAHDFSTGGSPVRFLARIASLCRGTGARLLVVYVPFAGVVHPRYASSLIKLGMPPPVAEALHQDPRYRGQNRILAEVCASLGLTFADTTDDLVRADEQGVPQYWAFDTHPRPAGYATIVRRIQRALQDRGR